VIELDFWSFGVIRLLVPLLILRRPLPGLMLAIYVDWLDWRLLDLDNATQADRDFYQVWDKLLDTYYLALALVVSLRWPDRLARNIGIGLFAFRLVGVAVLTATGAQGVLVAFPNLFENYVVFYFLYRFLANQELVFGSVGDAAMVVGAILLVQLPREMLLHLFDTRPWDMVRLPLAAGGSREFDIVFWVSVYLAPQVGALVALLRRTEEGVDWAPQESRPA
jgi:hypothetical protein